ncbi:hypothetical protein ACFL24_01925 [Patescibacteria group bacterium]
MKIKKGSRRIAFVLSLLTIKIPINIDGIKNNWGEFLFYWMTRHRFLQPTYFSFFGLLNLQLTGKEFTIEPENHFWFQLADIAGSGNHLIPDAHHLININNFCWSKKGLRILDYGSLKTQAMVIIYGYDFAKKFTLDYVHTWDDD